MRCEVEQNQFAECLQAIVNAMPQRTTYQVLQTVLLEVRGNRLIMWATDLDTYVRKEMPVTPDTAAPGKVLVPGRKLLELTSALEEPKLILVSVDSSVRLEAGRNCYSFAGLDPADFPEWPAVPLGVTMDLPLAVLETASTTTVFAAGVDQSRPAMTGVLLEVEPKELRMVATDGHRLALARQSGEYGLEAKMIIPTKAFTLLTQGEETVRVQFDNTKVGFDFANTTIISRLIEGPFPDYTRVMPKSLPYRLVVDRARLSSALRRSAVFAGPVTRPVRLELKPDSVRLLAETSELGHAEEILEATFTGKPLTTAFNAAFLLEILRHIPTEKVRVELDSAGGPGVFLPDQDKPDCLFLLMPLRLD